MRPVVIPRGLRAALIFVVVAVTASGGCETVCPELQLSPPVSGQGTGVPAFGSLGVISIGDIGEGGRTKASGRDAMGGYHE